MKKNCTLHVHPAGLWLYDQWGVESEHSIWRNIHSMADPFITQWVLRCNQYGYYPEIVFHNITEVA
jgi:hypothetical protein